MGHHRPDEVGGAEYEVTGGDSGKDT